MANFRGYFSQVLLILFVLWCGLARAAEFPLPPPGDDIIGKIQTAVVQKGDNFAMVAQRYDVSYYGLVESNPSVDPDNPPLGTVLVIPSQYILPAVPRHGIVVNVAELRLYYFPSGESVVYTYPVGIGREDWETPLGQLKIVQKIPNPTWYVPESIRKSRAADGVDLPKFVPPGPDNPLGDFALRLSKWTYLIHGTNDPTGVGRRSSSGCIRLYPNDIIQLFNMAKVDLGVQIINVPYKAGWQDHQLYLEAHLPLEEQLAIMNGKVDSIVKNSVNHVVKHLPATIDWDKANRLAEQHMGIPEVIGQVGEQ
ncbi:MAG: L,D-transpeptidase family protein [Gammaproteobacteria bacterium]